MLHLKSSGQISIIPKPELRGFWGSSLIKPPFRVTSADVVIICPVTYKIIDIFRSYEKDINTRSCIGYTKPFDPTINCQSSRAKTWVIKTRMRMLMTRHVVKTWIVFFPTKLVGDFNPFEKY